MFEAALPSDGATSKQNQSVSPLSRIRARGGISARIAMRDGVSCAVDVRDADGYKLRFPKSRDGVLEAAIVNTGGGVAGGDRVKINFEALNDTRTCITTPAAERIYRAVDHQPSQIDISLHLKRRAQLAWLPQETIVFDRARMLRRISADLAQDARLLVAETMVFGRAAMGETIQNGLIQDNWRIRRDGRLVFAEALRFDGEIGQTLSQAAAAAGRGVVSTLLLVSLDAEGRLDKIRHALANYDGQAAASAWNGLLIIRLVAADTRCARALISTIVPLLSDRHLPRVWSI